MTPDARSCRVGSSDGYTLWDSRGDHPYLAVEGVDATRTLAAGWYVLSGWMKFDTREHGVPPSLYVHHVEQSALADVELMLPFPRPNSRIYTLILFYDDIARVQFFPGTGQGQFGTRDFRLLPVQRERALLLMAGVPGGLRSLTSVRRLLRWCGATVRRGRKRATDELHAAYRRRTFPGHADEYGIWLRKYGHVTGPSLDTNHCRADQQAVPDDPLVSFLLWVPEPDERALRACLESLLGQVCRRWEALLVMDDARCPSHVMTMLGTYAERDHRVRVVRVPAGSSAHQACEAALADARGVFVAWLEQDSRVAARTIACISEVVERAPDTSIIYTDEDQLDASNRRREPYFKPDWNPDLLRSLDYIGHLVALRTGLVRSVGGFRLGADVSRSHDLLLRCSERVEARQITHIPEVLYHGRVSPVESTDVRAVAEHLERLGTGAVLLGESRQDCPLHVRWPLPQPVPKVCIVVPTRDHVHLLRRCVESVLKLSTYPEFELVVVDNRSHDREALSYLKTLGECERVRVLSYDAPFNYSALNNWAARQCASPLLAFINNDIEVITPDWLEEMAGFAVRPDVGAVGAMLYYPDNTIQHAGMLLGTFGIAGHVYARQRKGFSGYHGRAQVAQDVSAVTGACLVVRRTLFEAVGGLDEQLPIEFNDVDFCLRLRERGYLNVWTPFAQLYHHESASRSLVDADARRARSAGVARMLQRWSNELYRDPAYNPNLSLQSLDYDLAFPPRVEM